MAKARKKAVKGGAKKKWVKIAAPRLFNSQIIGETYVYEAREGIGKPLTANLMNLTRNPKRQGTNVMFVVTGQQEDRLVTELVGMKMMPSVVRRMVRRGKNRIDDSFICMTSDKKKVRVKPFAVTRTKTKGSVLTALRKAVNIYVKRAALKSTYEDFTGDILEYKFQREMRNALAKVYPLSACEIRWFQLLGKEEATAEQPKQQKETKEKAEEAKASA